MSKQYNELIVGLDIGTAKVTCMVAEVKPDGRLNVVGLGTQPTNGLKRGVVVNIEATVDAISRVVQEVELMADCKIHEVYTGLAGSHIKSFNSSGTVAIKEKEVSPLDVERVIEVARAMPIPAEQQILHILTQEFIIDGQGGVREPIGMSGVRLEVKVHIVTGAVSAAQNVIKCVRRCGLEVMDLSLQPLASSHAVLTEDEKELGVCMVDIGGGTTDIAVFTQGAIRHTAVIPVAGDQITNDIAMALRTPTAEAEEIKIRHGVAMHHMADPEEMIEVPGVGDRPPRTQRLRGTAVLGHRADRRLGGDARHGRARRGRLSHARARGGAAVRRRPRRRGLPAALRHRDGPGDGGRGAAPAGAAGTRHAQRETIFRAHEGLVRAQLLNRFPGDFHFGCGPITIAYLVVNFRPGY